MCVSVFCVCVCVGGRRGLHLEHYVWFPTCVCERERVRVFCV